MASTTSDLLGLELQATGENVRKRRKRKAKSQAEKIERFLSLALPEPNSGCWLWTGEIKRDGYTECWCFGRRELGHRAAYREFVCDIPENLVVRHSCDEKSCVNPNHLAVGTQAQNIADKVLRNRQAKGEGHGNAKLTEDAVRFIRAETMSQRALARKFNVTQAAVSAVQRRLLWQHIA